MPVVQQLTDEGDVAIFWRGVNEPVLLDARALAKLINNSRDLQAMLLQGVIWP